MAREVLDSRGRPMVEVDVRTAQGTMGRAASPCGTSVGRHEAYVLRDGGKRFGGLGVQKAIRNVLEMISPVLRGKSVFDQRGIDQLMNDLDGTPDKSRLGSNTTYSVSVAVARAAACLSGSPLYRYLGGVGAHILPVPMFNMVNGGPHSAAKVEFQEFLLMPTGAESYSEASRMGVEVYYELGRTIEKRHGSECLHFGHSGGYLAPVFEPSEILDTLLEAAETAGYGGKFRLGLDCAASHFYDELRGCYHFRGKETSREELILFLEGLTKSYSLFILEDPLHEDDYEGFAEATRRLNTLVAGDDLFVTNLKRLEKGVAAKAAGAVIFKPNMVGTLSEAFDTACYAREHGFLVIPSSRAGGSVDDPIPDIAVGINARLVKFGCPQTGERTSYHNRMLRIEEELGESARFCNQIIRI
jgi:enolase